MKVSCSQETLKRVLGTYLESTHVCLTASAPSPEQTGCLNVVAWRASHTPELAARLPALVEKPGWVMVPAKLIAKGLASMHPGQVTLSLVEVAEPSVLQKRELIKALKAGPALQIESAGISARGTASTRRVRIRLGDSPQDVSVATPDIARGSATGVRLAEVAPARLRAALAPCLALAQERDESPESFPRMNHALVLVRFEAAHLQWTGTTRYAVASRKLPLRSPASPAPFSHALFDERALKWLCAALVGMKQPVRLTLLPQAESQVMLLVENAQVTLFCQGVTEPIPFVWETRLHLPATTRVVVPRATFRQTLSSFWKARAGEAEPLLFMWATRNLLCLQSAGRAQDLSTIEQQIPLLNTAEEISPVLVNLRHMQQLVRFLRGSAICLEIETFGHKKRSEVEKSAGAFLRFSSPADSSTRLMMTTSRPRSSPVNTSGNGTPAAAPDLPEEEAEQEGATLAYASAGSRAAVHGA